MPVIAHRPLSAADAPTCRLWPCSVRLLKCGRDVIAECAGNVRGSRDHVAEADDGSDGHENVGDLILGRPG